MRPVLVLFALPFALTLASRAADRPPAPQPVVRIDSLIATEANGVLVIQAKGAVGSGGWRGAMLKQVKSPDAHIVVVQFLATPPLPGKAVIPGLLPVSASTTIRIRGGIVTVRALSGSNEITTEILK